VLATTPTCSVSLPPLYSSVIASVAHFQVSTAQLLVVSPCGRWLASPVHPLNLLNVCNDTKYRVLCLTL